MKIEWSSYRPDGSKRSKPPPNALHGWLAKMRGTLTGNEELRTRGMREMSDARRYKEHQARMAKATGSRSSAPPPSRRLTRDSHREPSRSQSYSSKRSTHTSSSRPRAQHRSSHSSSRTAPGAYSAPHSGSRPSTQRRHTTSSSHRR